MKDISEFKVKEINGENYLVILESQDSKERHYWLPDGSYDGHDFKVENNLKGKLYATDGERIRVF